MSALIPFLLNAGYRQVPLSRNGVGHFQAAGSIGGLSISVLVDTGAASTLLDVSVARRAGLTLTPLDARGGGAGGANLQIFQVVGAELLLGDIVPRPRTLLAMDLGHVNQALATKGAEPVEAILGVDVFEAQAAIIDYGSSSLFLRP